ncbi:hypothetical protein FRZ67_18480 [Panacibacter ginsenosidivorans]|uniref:Uncharacterized protein n=1 Tax=Panacibacter ginsenosidivorans TaxID=1813871 RepID=A0A5B8VDY0_9BACT|nr:hypothetical protein [Panacibacter ginsenosidivorans]QEC69201.1 hypothetical protein FRZ67_18480 [Panacibacter ginsenosidivorans]
MMKISRSAVDTQHYFYCLWFKIPPEFWDKRKLCIKESLPKEFGEQEKLNDEIARQFRLASDLIKFAKRQEVAELGLFTCGIFMLYFSRIFFYFKT